MSQHLPFGADTLVIPFTVSGPGPRSVAPGMSRMRRRSDYRMVPPGPDAPPGSIAPVRVPRQWWDAPLSFTSQGGPAGLLQLASDKHGHGFEREEEERQREMPEPMPGLRPRPAVSHPGHGQPSEILEISPLLFGGGRGGAHGAPAQSRPAAPLPGPAGAENAPAWPSNPTLRQKMKASGTLEDDDPRQSHHSVPRGGAMNGGRDPLSAQDELLRLGIDVDSFENGVPLSRAFHAKFHTSAYYRSIARRLEEVTSAEQMTNTLNALRAELLEADKFYQSNGQLPEWISGGVE